MKPAPELIQLDGSTRERQHYGMDGCIHNALPETALLRMFERGTGQTCSAAGHAEASHIGWIGKRGWKDWDLKAAILDGDWTFVNKNSVDFRGPHKSPGSRGQYSDVALHAGLTCTNGPVGMDLDLQLELFQAALDELDLDSNLARVPRNNRLIHQLSRYLPTADSSYFYLLFGHTAGVPVFAR